MNKNQTFEEYAANFEKLADVLFEQLWEEAHPNE